MNPLDGMKDMVKKAATEAFRESAKDLIKQAVIVDNKDPEKKGRVKIRVAGVHPSDLPEDQLPWVQLSPKLGSNQGQGDKDILQIGQFAEVKALTSGMSEWMVTSGSSIVREELNQLTKFIDEDGIPFSNVVNDILEGEFIPKLASKIEDKIKDTVYGIIDEKL
jgi:hypothetical protein